MSSFGVKVIRAAFGAAEHVAPGLAGRVAFELFCRTPNPMRMSAGESRAVGKAAEFMDEARHHRIRTGRGWVVVHEFRPLQSRPNSGTVLMIHGWRSRTEFMKGLIVSYRDAGFRVVSLDLPGHGASPGRRLTLVDASEAVHAAAEWFGPFSAIVGHSFGGAIAANALAGSIASIEAVDADSLVLIAAPSSMPAIFEDFFGFLNLGPRTRVAVVARLERIAGHPLGDFNGTKQLARAAVPTLVLHAPDDREVPAWHAESYAKAGPFVQLHWAPGLGHRRILSDPDMIGQTLNFVAREPAAIR